MKHLFVLSAFLFIHSASAQSNLTVLEPLKALNSEVISPAPTDGNPGQGPVQSPQQGPGQGPQQGPQQGPAQSPNQVPHPPHQGGKGGKGGSGGGEYDGGSAEFEQIYYTPAYISKMIAENMQIQCYRGLCEMAMVDTHGSAFVVETYAGYGQQNGLNGGGLGTTGGSTVVVSPTGYNNTSQPYLGVSIRYVHQSCKQSIRVPTALYVSMNTYLYNLINEDGTTKRTFDPAEQTMILFYTTVMKQATGCTTPTR